MDSEYIRGLKDALEIAQSLVACHSCGNTEAACRCPYSVVMENGPAAASQEQIVMAIYLALTDAKAGEQS